MAVKTNLEQIADRIDEIKQRFQPAAREVVKELGPAILSSLKAAWPTPGPAHPYATGESKRGLFVRQMAAGVSVRNKAPHWSYVGKSNLLRNLFGYRGSADPTVTDWRRSKRGLGRRGLIYRAMPAIVGHFDGQIRENMTEQLIHALTPEEG